MTPQPPLTAETLYEGAWIAGQTPVLICKMCSAMFWPLPNPGPDFVLDSHAALHGLTRSEAPDA